jgi:formiminotetrahydrofolate cyclodeaminase
MAARFADRREAVERAAALRAELLEQGERELASYEPVLEALHLPVDDPTRAARMDAALTQASAAPFAIARAAAAVAELVASLALDGKPSLAGDAIAGAFLAEAACRAAARLVEINLSGRRSDSRLGEVKQLVQRAAAARARALGQ